MEEGRCQLLECVCKKTAEAEVEAQRTGTLDLLCPHPVEPEEGRIKRNLGEEGVRARKGTLRGRGMMVQEQELELVQTENLKNKEDEIQQVNPVVHSDSSRVRLF